MALGEVLLRWTVITMVPVFFLKNNFEGYLSQSQTWECLMRFYGSRTSSWTQISWEGTIFEAEHGDRRNFPIFELFGKSRNNLWDPPFQIRLRVKSSYLNSKRPSSIEQAISHYSLNCHFGSWFVSFHVYLKISLVFKYVASRPQYELKLSDEPWRAK